MNLNLITLNTRGRVDFDEEVDMSTCKDDKILSFERVHVKGAILDNGTDEYEIDLEIKGRINLKSSINETPVPLELDIKYSDFINNLVEKYKNSSNSLDILPIIWENILLEIPIRAVNETDTFETTHGEGWEILEDDE